MQSKGHGQRLHKDLHSLYEWLSDNINSLSGKSMYDKADAHLLSENRQNSSSIAHANFLRGALCILFSPFEPPTCWKSLKSEIFANFQIKIHPKGA